MQANWSQIVMHRLACTIGMNAPTMGVYGNLDGAMAFMHRCTTMVFLQLTYSQTSIHIIITHRYSFKQGKLSQMYLFSTSQHNACYKHYR